MLPSFGTHHIYKCFKLMFLVLRGVPKNSKFSQFQIFSKLGPRGGDHHISNFSQIQKSPKHPGGGGGGVKKIVDFFHFCDIF